jgi:hypothetical protein
MDWLMGRVEQGGRTPFMADLQWLASPTNMAKVLNGRYASRASPGITDAEKREIIAKYTDERGQRDDRAIIRAITAIERERGVEQAF